MWICDWICVCEGTAVWPSISIIRKPAMVGRDETLFSEVWEDSSSVFTRVVKVHSETLCQLHWDMKTVGFDSTFTSCIWTLPTPTTCFFSRRKYCWKTLWQDCLYSWFTRVNRHLLHSGGRQLRGVEKSHLVATNTIPIIKVTGNWWSMHWRKYVECCSEAR